MEGPSREEGCWTLLEQHGLSSRVEARAVHGQRAQGPIQYHFPTLRELLRVQGHLGGTHGGIPGREKGLQHSLSAYKSQGQWEKGEEGTFRVSAPMRLQELLKRLLWGKITLRHNTKDIPG